jgi:hypothetical protein
MIKYYRRFLDDPAVQRRWLDPRLFTVRVPQIQAYLLEKRWQPVTPDRPGMLVFQEPVVSEQGPLYQFVPKEEGEESYPAQVYQLLAALAEIEDRYAGDVLTDILRMPVANSSNGAPGAKTVSRTE